MKTPKYFFIYSLLFSQISVFAQISVSFPTSRAVFQRDNQNRGFINIIGNYAQTIEKIEARLIPVVNGQGIATDWVVVDSKPKAGNFVGRIEGLGGWYRLEIRSFQNGNVNQTINIDRVGIGEVFICLGQSNAEGLYDYGAKSAVDDRVNAINYQDSKLNYPLPEILNFTKLTSNVDIAPHGNTAWCWGELGDKLAQRLNVPILFFNAGLARTAVKNWRESAEGILSRRYDDNGNGQTHFPQNYPYNFLRGTLNYYASLFGVRSLLWMQGETDNRRTSLADHQSDLQKVVNYSRKDFDDNLTWMIARTSISWQLPPDNNTLTAQNNVINTPNNNVFAGPETDNIQQPRPDGIHIGNIAGFGDGLSQLANAWNNSLNSNFFSNSRPILAKSIINYDIFCNESNNSVIKLQSGFRNYDWSNGSKTNEITAKGNLSAIVYDTRGNRILTPNFATDFILPVSKPTITATKPIEFCPTDSTELRVRGTEFNSFVWNTGEKNERIIIKKEGDFTAKGINSFGCLSSESNKISTRNYSLPQIPKITSQTGNSACEGNFLTLSTDGNLKFLWNTGETTKTIKIEKVGNFDASVKAINEFGCISDASLVFKTTIKPRPRMPEISKTGVFVLTADKGEFLNTDKFEWKKDENILPNSSLQNLKTIQTGNYKVSTIRIYQGIDNQTLNCFSLSSNQFSFTEPDVSKVLYPIPAFSDIIYLESKESLKNLSVGFYDLRGILIKQFLIPDATEKQTLKISDLPNGNYSVKISNESFTQIIKVLVEK